MGVRICLCMIVKDEAPVIQRCLDSVRGLVDDYCIVDTGSVDETRSLVLAAVGRHCMHKAKWVDFAHNRNLAMGEARSYGDYLLFLDADEVLEAPFGFKWPELTADAYYLPVEYNGVHYVRLALVSTRIDCKYVGVVHEYLDLPPGTAIERLDAPTIKVRHDGARARDPETYKKDVELLKADLAKRPDDPRTTFYLAESYKNAGMPEEARKWYLVRSAMKNGWDEEQWYAMYQAAMLADAEHFVPWMLKAYEMRPTRAEPLYQLAVYHRGRSQLKVAFMFARMAALVPKPNDRLFLDASIYEWRIADELGVTAFYCGETKIGRKGCADALRACPEPEWKRIRVNAQFYPRSTCKPNPDSSMLRASGENHDASRGNRSGFSGVPGAEAH